ncbi:MAG: hypothetical protein A2Y56_10370 [Candidatus Aminicenantes bacterium RBG_13_63_10]|nr:MAG: hypothetical protein A2Y56_10370 [Candidatus Aminicenantes bacterium RBG_13_63_10]
MRKTRRPALRSILILSLLATLPAYGSGGGPDFSSPGSIEEAPPALRAAWRKGDWTAVIGTMQVLIAGIQRSPEFQAASEAPLAPGSILICVPAGTEAGPEVNIGPPLIRLGPVPYYPLYSLGALKTSSRGESAVLEFSASFEGPGGEKAVVKSVYALLPDGEGIRLTSTIANTGGEDIKDLQYSLHVGPGTRYSFSPFNREKLPRLGYRLYHKRDHSLAWVSLHPPAEKEAPVPGLLSPGRSYTVDHALLTDREGEDLLRRVFTILGIKPILTKITVKAPKSRLIEFVVRDFLSSGVVYRDFLKDAPLLALPLPEGSYSVTANSFPAVIEGRLNVSASGDNSCVLDDPPRGTVMVAIRDGGGRHVPGKVSFIGLDPTRSPYFEPENPRRTETGWETFKNSCYPPEEGREVVLPVGVYLACASHGPEYTAARKVIEILEDSRMDLDFRLDRVLETPALLSLDPHLHTTFSDGTPGVPERLRSLVAEGVEAAVASDHNIIVDYEPVLKALELDRHLAVASGVEVTSGRAGIHFNAYPASCRAEEENNGAPPFRDYAAGPLFRASREKLAGALIQLNHPRAGNLGYFNNLSLDLESAAWISDRASLDFDLIEVMNGPFYHASNAVAVEDWLHLLNRGRFAPLVGSSDSHATDGNEPGYSRTYILLETPKTAGWTWADVARGLRAGRSFASNGPLLELRVNGDATFGDLTRVADGLADIAFSVRAAPWVDVSEARLIVNGDRKIVFPVRASAGQVVKISERVRLELKADSTLALEAVGRRTLYPVVQRPALSGQIKDAALPYALSNPVFVDVDGNGVFDPPRPEPVEFKKEIPIKQKVISRY